LDKETLIELLTIIRNEKGRIEAPEGGHDDDMMGLAIAHEIRDQVSFSEEEDQMEVPNHLRFNVEKKNETQYDYGEEVTIV